MNTLKVNIANCYGIRSLRYDFDFASNRVYAIYAPNGVMKTSLAQTFSDVALSSASRDRVFKDRNSERIISDEHGTEVAPAQVLVVRPYDQTFGTSEKTSTLLVDAVLRKEYEQLYDEIDTAKQTLLHALREQSGTRKDVETEISSTFTASGDFFQALLRIEDELTSQSEAPFADIKYDKIFSEQVLSLLNMKDVQSALSEYIRRYNELLDNSTYFRKGTFNYFNASEIATSLAKNGFFSAKHSVKLNADESLEITTEKQLEDLVQQEKDSISGDGELRRRFAAIDKLITKNVGVREFQEYVTENDILLAELSNVDKFKEDLWKSYLKKHFTLYEDVVEKFRAAQRRRGEIEDIAKGQRTQWEAVIEIFNRRFFVPFRLYARNRTSVILGAEPVLALGFEFDDGEGATEVGQSDLLEVLSSGEKKALYILNVIFEIEVRKKAGTETIFVIDDIADSFDYKNKYAIVQYLKEITDEPNFHQIILTHNFDFFRTLESRFVDYQNCLMAFKESASIELRRAEGIRNPFVNDWKGKFFTDPKKRIASIPFIRNIIEYTRGESDTTYKKLTSLLHWKDDTYSFTEADLDDIFNSNFGSSGSWSDPHASVVDNLIAEARACMSASEGVNFENKIVMSIAIRIMSEQFMIREIADPAFVTSIGSSQTYRLFERYRSDFPSETSAIATIESVLLMTPVNIHLNSFMYEPILDMSDNHLRKLLSEVEDLLARD